MSARGDKSAGGCEKNSITLSKTRASREKKVVLRPKSRPPLFAPSSNCDCCKIEPLHHLFFMSATLLIRKLLFQCGTKCATEGGGRSAPCVRMQKGIKILVRESVSRCRRTKAQGEALLCTPQAEHECLRHL